MTVITIVVVTYNSAAYVRRCLGSLLEFAPRRAHRIVVVDNASSDDTVNIIRAEFPQIDLVTMDENVGFGRGNNIGFAQCPAQYYYCHNADAYLQENVLDRVMDVMDADGSIGVAGLPLVFPDLTPQTSAYSATTPKKWILHSLGVGTAVRKLLELDRTGSMARVLGRTDMGKSFIRTHTQSAQDNHKRKPVEDVDWVCGASLVVRGTALDQLSPGFDPDIFMYGEDEDMCLRAHRLGWRITQVDTVPVIHEFGWGKNVRASRRVVDLKYAGLRVFIDKNFVDRPVSRVVMQVILRMKYAVWRAKAANG